MYVTNHIVYINSFSKGKTMYAVDILLNKVLKWHLSFRNSRGEKSNDNKLSKVARN